METPILDGWPKTKPRVPPYMHGWLAGANQKHLQRLIRTHKPKVIVELGSWYGKSATFMFSKAPKDTTMYCVDMWDEAFIKQMWANRGKNYKQHVPFIDKHPLHTTFMVNLWPYRSRLTPLKMGTREGLRSIGEREPHQGEAMLIYIDAGHEYDNVLADLTLSVDLFPMAIVCGDDWKWPDVQRAIKDYCNNHGLRIKSDGNFWELCRS